MLHQITQDGIQRIWGGNVWRAKGGIRDDQRNARNLYNTRWHNLFFCYSNQTFSHHFLKRTRNNFVDRITRCPPFELEVKPGREDLLYFNSSRQNEFDQCSCEGLRRWGGDETADLSAQNPTSKSLCLVFLLRERFPRTAIAGKLYTCRYSHPCFSNRRKRLSWQSVRVPVLKAEFDPSRLYPGKTLDTHYPILGCISAQPRRCNGKKESVET